MIHISIAFVRRATGAVYPEASDTLTTATILDKIVHLIIPIF